MNNNINMWIWTFKISLEFNSTRQIAVIFRSYVELILLTQLNSFQGWIATFQVFARKFCKHKDYIGHNKFIARCKPRGIFYIDYFPSPWPLPPIQRWTLWKKWLHTQVTEMYTATFDSAASSDSHLYLWYFPQCVQYCAIISAQAGAANCATA